MTSVLRELWDFEDPAGSEQRFRRLAEDSDEPVAAYASTQVARALGLQGRYDEGHAVLDALSPGDAEARVRLALERGRLLRSAGEDAASRTCLRRLALTNFHAIRRSVGHGMRGAHGRAETR